MAVVHYAVLAVRFVTAGYGIGIVIASVFNGAGDTKTPTIINLFRLRFFYILFVYILSETFAMDSTGVFIALPVA